MRLANQFDDEQIKLLGQITAEFPLLDTLLSLTLAHLKGKGIEIGSFVGHGFETKRKQIKKLLKSEYRHKPYATDLLNILSAMKAINQRRVDITHGLAAYTDPTLDGNRVWVRERKDKNYPDVTTEFLRTLLADMRATNERLTTLLLEHGLLNAEPLAKSS